MRCFVFGGSGFIGKYLIEELLRDKHSVINIDLEHYDQISVHDGRYAFHRLDICSSTSSIKDLFYNKPPDMVFILSAISDIEECEKDPSRALRVNLLGLCNILDIVSCIHKTDRIGPPKIIFASSLYSVFPMHPYGISKAAGEKLLKWYSEKYHLSYLILRYGTIYGLGASNNNGIKRLVRRSIEEGAVTHYGIGEERREYIHVRDAARSSVELSFGRVDETIIISGADSVKADRLCTMLNELLNYDGPVYYAHGEPDGHYLVTPYRVEEDAVSRYNPSMTVDFGHGLMEVINEVEGENNA